MKVSIFKGLIVLLTVFSLVHGPSHVASAAAETGKKRLIMELLSLTGAVRLGDQMLKEMLSRYAQALPKVPQSFWDDFSTSVKTKKLIKKLVTVYDKHLSESDIQGLIQFYSSPLGKKFVSVQPALVADSMEIGREWGQAVAKRLLDQLKKKGYVKEEDLKQPAK